MPSDLSDRTRGWLRFVWDKATTPDDWSENGTPNPWWDRQSLAPMCAFPRFDLGESAYILPILADQTPAWREVYTRIADELVGRHTTFWAAIDWLTLIGDDPHRDQYPPEWLAYLPPQLQGRYNPPGWTGNGIEPWGLQPDPIGADGNLFFRGFFNLLLSVYRYVAGDEKWEQPFQMTGYRNQRFEWSHHRIAEFINLQWQDRPQGPHCENTKIWPFCVSAAGLGLQLYDRTTGSDFHDVSQEWLEYAQKHYLTLDARGGLKSFPWYYDPLEEVLFGFPSDATAFAALSITPYVLPQNREFGEFLYRESVRLLGWDNPAKPMLGFVKDPRFLAIGLMIAREVGDTVTEQRIREVAERDFEPRWFGDEDTRFGWWFGTGEPYPRGQISALMMVSETGEPGAWTRVFQNNDLHRRFDEPTVEGVDYPTLGLTRAWNDLDAGVLRVATFAATPSRRGSDTSFRVTNLPDPAAVSVRVDGADYPRWRVTGDDSIEINTDVGDRDFEITTGLRASAGVASAGMGTDRARISTGMATQSRIVSATSRAYSMANVRSCSCC